jgi:prolipoprotein diacylglyceryltransferase
VSIAPEAPPRWPFILTGAIIGGVAAGAWYGYQVARSDDPMLDFTVPVVGLGIGVGALGGWLVGEVVRATHATTRD